MLAEAGYRQSYCITGQCYLCFLSLTWSVTVTPPRVARNVAAAGFIFLFIHQKQRLPLG